MEHNENTTQQPQTIAMDSRVGRLEGVVQTLGNEVHDIAVAVRSITESLGNFKEDVLGKIGVATAPKWPLIASLSTMTLTILGLCGTIVAIMLSGQSDAINQNRTGISVLNQQAVIAAHESGKIEARTDTIMDNISNLDTKVQQEISLQNQQSLLRHNSQEKIIDSINKRQIAVEGCMRGVTGIEAQVEILLRNYEYSRKIPSN